MFIEKSPEMRLFSPPGERLYLTIQERKLFLSAVEEEDRENRIFCNVLHYAGCRPSEALELSSGRILIDETAIVFRSLKKTVGAAPNNQNLEPFWTMSRPTAYRLVKRIMVRAGITGKKATGKGWRHSFGVTMVTGSKPLPIHILAQIMGHSSTKTTEIYLRVVGEEKQQLVLDAWKALNKR